MTAQPDPGGLDEGRSDNAATRGIPRLLIFDVNETLSDMAPLAERFADVGAPGHLAATWFASLLRDGFALTATGQNPPFGELAKGTLRAALAGRVDDADAASDHIMAGFVGLPLHPDVIDGVRALHGLGITLVTLSNGSASIARDLLHRNGLADLFTRLLSVEDTPLWKPAKAAYASALAACGVAPGEAMLIAAHPWDLHGAHRAGLRTAWVNRSGAGYPAYFDRPDIEASSMTDLAALLHGLPR